VAKIQDHNFIFLCGLHRSGTSPLFRILREHPEISGFRDTGAPEDEGQHLQSVIPPAKAFGGPGHFGFAPEAHLTEASNLATRENGQKLFEQWSIYWDKRKRFLLEKSPPNLIRTRFLQAMFPKSHFIVIFRHPIATSLATKKWTSSSLESLIEHWLHCHRLFGLDRPNLRRVHTLKYEDLISSTTTELEKIYKFLNLPFHPSPDLDPTGNDPYFDAWRRLSTDPAGQVAVRRIVSACEDKIRPYGYSLTDCIPTTPTAAVPQTDRVGKTFTGH
jgi:hypothetical protein